MQGTSRSYPGAFFVPHDLAAPIAGAPSGPLAGLTVAVKDMFDIAGTWNGLGNPTWLAAHAPAARNAAVIEKLLEAGASVIGKTICEEMVYSVLGITSITVRRQTCGHRDACPADRRADRRQPPRLASAISKGGAVMGFGLASTERYVLDPQIGLPANTGFLGQKPMSYLDVPSERRDTAVSVASFGFKSSLTSASIS
jgi:hypothetical protein